MKKLLKKKAKKRKEILCLVIDYDKVNWFEAFESFTSEDFVFSIDQAQWKQLSVISYDGRNCVVNISPNDHPRSEHQKKRRSFSPDIILVRQLVCGLKNHQNYTNVLTGLMYANIPAVNSLQSVFMNLQRPVVWSEMKKIEKKHGKKKFPLIEQNFYRLFPFIYFSAYNYFVSEPLSIMFTPKFPIVLKFGNAEAGYGKVKVDAPGGVKDIAGCLTQYSTFVTAEPYLVKKDYDLRIQKIGDHYRAYKRVSSVNNWKSNVGSSVLTEIKVEDRYKVWAEECGKMFGGMSILTVDAVHCSDGSEFIIEINGSASGFYKDNMKEDMEHVIELVVDEMQK